MNERPKMLHKIKDFLYKIKYSCNNRYFIKMQLIIANYIYAKNIICIFFIK